MRSKNCSGPLEVAFNWKETPRRFWRYEGTRIYSCDPNHYIRLCRRHHSQYDYGRKAPLISRKAVLREIRRRQSVVF